MTVTWLYDDGNDDDDDDGDDSGDDHDDDYDDGGGDNFPRALYGHSFRIKHRHAPPTHQAFTRTLTHRPTTHDHHFHP